MTDSVLQDRLQTTSRLPALTASDPSSVFAIKSLLHPVTAVSCLLICLLVWREPLSGPYFLLAVLAFFAAADFLDGPVQASVAGSLSPGSLLDIALRWMLVVGFLWALLHLSGVGDLIHWQVIATWAFMTPLVLWFGEIGVHQALYRAGSGSEAPRKAVILGLTDLGLRLKQQLDADPLLRLQVEGFFDDRSPERLPSDAAAQLLGKLSSLPRYVRREDIKVVYITLPATPQPQLLELLNALQDSTVSIYFVPDLFTFDLIQARVDVIGGMPIVAVRETPFYGAHAIAKRVCDIVIATVLLLIAAPMLLFTAVGVRLSSPGPIIFKQRRYGLDGQEILIYKFRSMSVTEDGASQYTQVTRDDKRVTAFGAFIRRTSLDELPQLFNVLQGTLSVVGPRPHAIVVNEQYRKLIPGYMIRHKVKPGITGWAQVNGYRGGDDLESMRKRIEFDLEYLRHWSLMLDLSIILRTAALVWRDSTAY